MTLTGHKALWYANRAVLWLNGKSNVLDNGTVWQLPINCQ